MAMIASGNAEVTAAITVGTDATAYQDAVHN